MKRFSIFGFLAMATFAGAPLAGADDTNDDTEGTDEPEDVRPDAFSFRVVATGLDSPWEITRGPDGYLWVTERVGKTVTRVHPATGAKTIALRIPEAYQASGQDGVLGMALHPELLRGTGNDFVYVAFTYDADPTEAVDRRTKLRRYVYDAKAETLGQPVDLIVGLPGSNDHNAGRIAFGPDQKLYYTIGDQGNNQFANVCRRIRAQDLPTRAEVLAGDFTKYQGKTLRLDLDGSIPEDNPVIAGARSHIFTYGHRNPQGIAFGPDGTLYSSEQGPKTDDEVNVLRAGKNYGWPHIAGYRDDQAYVYGNWSASSPTPCAELTFSDFAIPASVPVQKETDWLERGFVEPIATFYTVPNDYDFQDPACGDASYICWPTIAPSSIDVYAPRRGIRGWGKSLLVTSLKRGTVERLALRADGKTVRGRPVALFRTTNRYRDLALEPDGRTFYIVTDNAGLMQDPSGGYTSELANPGSILEFRSTGGGKGTD